MKLKMISEKDKKTIKFGVVALCLILGYAVCDKLIAEYSQTAGKLKTERSKFKSILPDKNGNLTRQQAGIMSIVPVFEMPEKESIPGQKFKEQFIKQLKASGIKFTTLNQLPMSNKKNPVGFRTLRFQCKGKCNFHQSVDILAKLYENPLFVAVEEFKIECDSKKRTEMDITLTVSTFVK